MRLSSLKSYKTTRQKMSTILDYYYSNPSVIWRRTKKRYPRVSITSFNLISFLVTFNTSTLLDCNETRCESFDKISAQKKSRSFTFDDRIIILNASLRELNDPRAGKLSNVRDILSEPKPTKSELSLRENPYARVSTEG